MDNIGGRDESAADALLGAVVEGDHAAVEVLLAGEGAHDLEIGP